MAILRRIQEIETDEGFAGVLSVDALAAALSSPARATRAELQRLLDGGYVRASGEGRDLGGGWDLIDPRLTAEGVAVVAA